MDELVFPLALRYVRPTDDAVLITGTRADGLPDGVHTGGVWKVGQEAWKPLDGRPFGNAECHIPTEEDICLTDMAEYLLFPRNWRVAERNGRRFLVRRFCKIYGTDIDWKEIDRDQALMVEQGIRALNRKTWELNDPISLGVDEYTRSLFIVDLSIAHRCTGTGIYAADDSWRINEFFTLTGHPDLRAQREAARHLVSEYRIQNILAGFPCELEHVYATDVEPTGVSIACYGHCMVIHPEMPGLGIPKVWVMTEKPIPQGIACCFGLEWAWSPIIHNR